jgi:hypothetical protein
MFVCHKVSETAFNTKKVNFEIKKITSLLQQSSIKNNMLELTYKIVAEIKGTSFL